jgi:hypothetical protein
MLALTTSVPLSRKRRRIVDESATELPASTINITPIDPLGPIPTLIDTSAERILRPSTNEAKIRVIAEHLSHAPLRKALTQANQLGPRAAGRGRGRAETQAQACEKR